MSILVIARSEATKQSSLSSREELDCFASLAMTGMNLKIRRQHRLERGVLDHRQHHDLVHAGGTRELRGDAFVGLQMFVDRGHAGGPGAADAAFALADSF